MVAQPILDGAAYQNCTPRAEHITQRALVDGVPMIAGTKVEAYKNELTLR